MKTLAKMSVLAVILGVAMMSGTAKADFDNQQVKNVNAGLNLFSRGLQESIRRLGLPRGEQVFFRTRLNRIAENTLEIDALANGPDNQVQDDIEALARDIRNLVRQMLDRAEQLENDDLVELMEQLLDVTDQLVGLVD